jgi:hypothetical protein
VGEEYVLTIRDPSSVGAMAIGVSYDAFVDDVEVRGSRKKPACFGGRVCEGRVCKSEALVWQWTAVRWC